MTDTSPVNPPCTVTPYPYQTVNPPPKTSLSGLLGTTFYRIEIPEESEVKPLRPGMPGYTETITDIKGGYWVLFDEEFIEAYYGKR